MFKGLHQKDFKKSYPLPSPGWLLVNSCIKAFKCHTCLKKIQVLNLEDF